MQYKNFGRTGIRVSAIGFGSWQAGMNAWGKDYSVEDVRNAIRTAYDLGVTIFDTAEVYGNGLSEKILGEELRNREAFIATKLAGYNSRDPEKSIERSYRNIGRTIDLYQVHWVPSMYTNLDKLMKRLEGYVRKGKINHLGLSNFPLKFLKMAQDALSREEIVSLQIQYSILHREAELDLLDYCRESLIEIIAWSPLARGALTGKYFGKKMPPSISRYQEMYNRKHRISPELESYLKSTSDRYHIPISAIALRYVANMGMIPIPGSKNPAQASMNSSVFDYDVPDEIYTEIERLSRKYRDKGYKNLVPRVIPNFMFKLVAGKLL
ncbi:MAG: aldo/keto reductase [Candidatus Thermoplasmatota archaeon]|nr:aldo/keto reductase [Candidatus Thermoplasmatota archaeon]MCL5730807.1 aldo/keto reductase [Candidatus Thermoplasmatota archaeon]